MSLINTFEVVQVASKKIDRKMNYFSISYFFTPTRHASHAEKNKGIPFWGFLVRMRVMKSTFSILIAEDDPVLREAYLRRFALTNLEIRTAQNGEQAIAEIRKKAPDLLICDIMMPVHDGFWVLEQLPKKARTFPVIMLTNMEDDVSQKKCTDMGVDGYLVKKNMSLHTLVSMTEQLLHTSLSPKKKSSL